MTYYEMNRRFFNFSIISMLIPIKNKDTYTVDLFWIEGSHAVNHCDWKYIDSKRVDIISRMIKMAGKDHKFYRVLAMPDITGEYKIIKKTEIDNPLRYSLLKGELTKL